RPILPWFLLSDTPDLTIPAGSHALTLPTGYIREYEEGGVYRLSDDPESWEKLLKTDHNQSLRHSGTGTPSRYAILGNKLLVFPTPAEGATLRLIHYAAATALETNASNVWLQYAPELLILLTGARCGSGNADALRHEAERQWALLADESSRRRFEQQPIVIEVQ
ncbi:MAG: hypothetical protein HQM00_15545, partial [Magnetococcales bacterium]|nr:hypothetical protein [Magnetococcales bacterium]